MEDVVQSMKDVVQNTDIERVVRMLTPNRNLFFCTFWKFTLLAVIFF